MRKIVAQRLKTGCRRLHYDRKIYGEDAEVRGEPGERI